MKPLFQMSLGLLFDRVLPALFWFIVAYNSYNVLFDTIGSTNDLLIISNRFGNCAFLLLITTLYITRKRVIGSRAKLFEAFIAFAGTFSLSLLAFNPIVETPRWLMAAANLVSLVGIAWSLISLASLGRCFGILPEARGLIARGPYRLVRHPLYLGEILYALGMVLASLSAVSVGIWLLVVGLQLWRSHLEERALLEVFPEYAHYQRQTSFRIIPWAW